MMRAELEERVAQWMMSGQGGGSMHCGVRNGVTRNRIELGQWEIREAVIR